MNQEPGNSQKILIRLPSTKQANINLLSVAESGNQFVTQSPKQVGVPVRIQTFTTSSRNNNVLVQGTPVIMVQPTTDSNQNMPQLVSEKRMLCSNCGATLKEPLKYKCCSKSSIRPIQVTSLQKPTTQPRACLGGYSSPAKVKPRQNRRMNASTFYGERNGASEFHSFLASKRRNETLKVKKSCQLVPQDNNCKSEFITISDSSDEAEVETDVGKESAKKQKIEELQPSEDTTLESTCNNSPNQPESVFLQQVHTNGDDSPIPCKRRKESLNENEAVQSTTETTSHIQATCQKTLPAWKTATLCVLLKSVRIGQFHHKEPVQSRWSGKDISMTMQSCIVQIPWYAISKVELSVEDPQACIFFTIDNDYVPLLRSQLGMVPGKIPYFDPGGTDDQIFIIFYICSQWHSIQGDLIPQKLDFLRRKLQKPQSFVAKLTRTESNNRQCRIANAELVQHFGKTNISKELTPHQSPAQNHHSKSMMVSSPVGSSQVAKHTTQILHVGMSPEQKLIRFTRSRSNRLPQAVAVNDCIDVHPVFQGQRKQLAIYPPPPAKGGITITNEDQFCLNEGEFLNDVIIDFYLKYIMEEILSTSDRDRSHIFSCFFYKRLTQNPAGKAKANEDKNLNPSERRHRRVQKWTRNVDLFEKDFVFIPINEASHWFLAVICFPGQKVGYFVDSVTGTQVAENRLPQLVLQPVSKQSRQSPHCAKKTLEPQTESETIEVSSVAAPGAPSAASKSPNPCDDQTLNKPTKELAVNVVRLNINIASSGLVKIANEYGDDKEISSTEAVKTDNCNIPENNEKAIDVCPDTDQKETNISCTVNNCAKGSSPIFTDTVNGSPEKTVAKEPCLNQEKSEAPALATVTNSEESSSPSTYNFKFSDFEENVDKIQYREPCILIFDSLRGPSRSKTATIIREYLNLEWKTRKETTCGKRLFDKNSMKMSSPQVPQQDNYSDCGIFLLQYVEKVFQKPISNYALPIRNLLDWFDPDECKEKRKAINDIIEKLHEKQKQEKET